MKRDLRKPNDARWRVPPLLHFLGLHLILGAAIGTLFVSIVVLLNFGGLKDLLNESDSPMLPLLLLYGFNVLTFSGVTMGVAIMMTPTDKR